jgi:8-oxo-dGTP diphosphatase
MSAEHLVVAAAIIDQGRLLSCRRLAPPALAGRWEFPGGKVEPGENELDALVRECREELELDILVGERLGGDLLIESTADAPSGIRIHVYWASLAGSAQFVLHDHDDARWLAAEELFDVPWITADLALVAEVGQRLSAQR